MSDSQNPDESSAGLCIRCGDRLTPDKLAAPGLELCRECLTPRAVIPVSRTERFPPLWFGATLASALLGAGFVGVALAWPAAILVRALGLPGHALEAASVVAVLPVLFLAVRLRTLEAWLDRRWKRETAARLGLAHLPLERFRFAVLLERRESPRAEHVGLLAETDEALFFFGRSRSRTIRLSSIRGLTKDGFFGSWWACLVLTDGSNLWLTIREGGTAWGGSVELDALALRVQARLDDPEKAPAEAD